MAGRYDFNIEQGTTFERNITWKDSGNNPISFLGTTPKMQIRLGKKTGELYLDCTTYIENNNTNLKIKIPDEITKTLTPQIVDLLYDLILEKDGNVHKLIEGRIFILEGVTK